MRMIAGLVVAVLLAIQFMSEAEESRDLELKAIQELKASQDDPSKLVQAASLLVKAIEAYEKEGNDDKASQLSAYLYWTKKRMTVADAGVFAQDKGVSDKAIQVTDRKVEENQAKDWLQKADSFAANCQDPLLVAIRYFEVADRFRGSAEGLQAIDKSLKAMQQIRNQARQDSSIKPMIRKKHSMGKVFVESDPPGAQVWIWEDQVAKDSAKKTPALVDLEARPEPHVLLLKFGGYKDYRYMVQAIEGISKPGIQKLAPETRRVNVTYLEPGWQVFVDEKPVQDIEGKTAMTPCTVEVPVKASRIAIAKDGYQDISMPMPREGDGVEFKQKAWKGKGRLAESSSKPRTDKWFAQLIDSNSRRWTKHALDERSCILKMLDAGAGYVIKAKNSSATDNARPKTSEARRVRFAPNAPCEAETSRRRFPVTASA